MPLRQSFDQSKEFREVMLRFTRAMLAYISRNAAGNRLHNIEQRLARWLLECSDRLNSDELGLTHELIAEMLGVRRAGVSLSTSKLQDKGLIAKGRGVIKIIDWKRLEAVSCKCYAVLSEEYDWLLGRPVY